MYLAEKLAPDFRTISDFRKQNHQLVKEAFKHTVVLAKQAGALDLGHLATDGTKVKASAANKRMLTKDELVFLLKFIDKELEDWAKQDQLEDEKFGGLRGSDQLPDKSKKKIQQIVRNYVKKVEKRDSFKEKITQKLKEAHQEIEEHDLEKVSVTAPESRFMKNKKGKIEFSYNAQVTTDKTGFIVANDVCQDGNDAKQLRPQVLQTENNLGTLPQDVPWSFDNSYFEGENLAFLHEKQINGYVAAQKSSENPYSADKFVYNPEKDEYTCPAQQPVTFLSERYDKDRKKKFRIYKAQGCHTCIYRSSCTTNKKTGIRYLKVYPHRDLQEEMAIKMQTMEAKETYKLRAQTVEPVIGDIKHNKGVQEFFTRSLETVKTEFNLACIAHNIQKLWMQIINNFPNKLEHFA
jgi:transposase